MPRILGYVFNPVSFWLCLDKNNQLRCVLCEVHNTFGEKHTYICANHDHAAIKRHQTLSAKKVFHVSPFLQRKGNYNFKFEWQEDRFLAYINYDSETTEQLLTSLTGDLKPFTKVNIRKAFWAYPLITMKAISLIHWQAVKILFKRIKYIRKPTQLAEKVSAVQNLTKN